MLHRPWPPLKQLMNTSNHHAGQLRKACIEILFDNLWETQTSRYQIFLVNCCHRIPIFHASLLCPERRSHRRSRETLLLPLRASPPLPNTRSVWGKWRMVQGQVSSCRKTDKVRVEIGRNVDSFARWHRERVVNSFDAFFWVPRTMCAVIFSR